MALSLGTKAVVVKGVHCTSTNDIVNFEQLGPGIEMGCTKPNGLSIKKLAVSDQPIYLHSQKVVYT